MGKYPKNDVKDFYFYPESNGESSNASTQRHEITQLLFSALQSQSFFQNANWVTTFHPPLPHIELTFISGFPLFLG